MRFQKEKWVKYCSVIGAHFLTASMSFMWTYGNLAPYVDSYVKFSCSPDCADGGTQWILNLWLIGTTPGLFLVDPMVKIVGMKRLVMLSVLLSSLAVLASAWMLHISVIGASLLMGLLNGISVGVPNILSLTFINGWIPERSSIFTATVTSSAPVVAIIQNQIVTAYVNPLNLRPDVQQGSSAFFSQPQILERVPGAILIIAGMTLAVQVVGCVLVENPPVQQSIDKTDAVSQTHSRVVKDTDKLYDTFCPESVSARVSTPSILNGHEGLSHCESNSYTHYNMDSSKAPETCSHNTCSSKRPAVEVHESNDSKQGESTPVPSCKPSQALKTRVFWALCFYAGCMGYGVIIKNSFFKVFGLLYIPDDRFLTLLGSLIPLIEAICRVIFGAVLDKNIFNIKDCLVFGLSLCSVLFAFFYFAPQVNKPVYVILILALSFAQSLFFLLIALCTFVLFGPAHFALLYALVFMAPTTSSVVSALIVTPILQTLGWFWLFMTPSILSALGLGFVMITEFEDSAEVHAAL
ncbi:oxalate:formate antiporter [Plakobranchus ocellatus]|uniref:Oxalate:formate antiporter n=1 Tax=Plakobranchus ocellatus TaxID=259542 RepID=A0AAV4ARI9_9GAST|nr:oxalate:formate antiporter [Plakobranchus ocellatus]